MEIRKINDAISVAPQIHPDEVATLKGLGFRAIICNRPDGEADGQPSFAMIEQAASDAGLEIAFLPIVPGQLHDTDVAQFRSALTDLPGPILAYCRTGTRSTTVWGLAMAGAMSAADILSAAQAAGYDLSGVIGTAAKDG